MTRTLAPLAVAALETHRINSKQLVKLYLDRIAACEGTLNALITINPWRRRWRTNVTSSVPIIVNGHHFRDESETGTVPI